MLNASSSSASSSAINLQQRLAQAERQAEILQRVIEVIGSGLTLEPLLAHLISIGVELANATHLARADASTISTTTWMICSTPARR